MRGLGLRDDYYSENHGEWSVVDRKFHDPGMTLVVEHNTKGCVGQPAVTIKISYGKSE